jgi:chromosome segregation ATPase
MPTAEELQQEIDENESELRVARIKLVEAKNKLTEVESHLISLKIKETNLKEALQKKIASTPKPRDYQSEEEQELERFRAVLPELMKRLA